MKRNKEERLWNWLVKSPFLFRNAVDPNYIRRVIYDYVTKNYK